MLDREQNGVLGQVKLAPAVYTACESVNPKDLDPYKVQLPMTAMTTGDQKLLIKLYALNDGRCPVKGCEPWSGGKGYGNIPAPIGGYAILPGAPKDRMRDSRGYLTGNGIRDGFGSCSKPQSARKDHPALVGFSYEATAYTRVCLSVFGE